MRDYALGLTSETFVTTPPVSLEPNAEAKPENSAPRPLSLLSGDLLQSQEPAAAPEPTSALEPTITRDLQKKRPNPASKVVVEKQRPSRGAKPQKSRVFSSFVRRGPIAGEQKTITGADALRRYVALGDFAVPADATDVARAFDLWNPRIQHVYMRGRHYRRVLVGPFSDGEIKSVQQHLDQHGFSTAWPLRTTADATPETLIARYPGDG